MLGFTESDIELQAGIVDSYIEHENPQCLSELQSIKLFDDTENLHRTSSTDTSSAIKSQPLQLHSLSKKCVEKASCVKRSSFSKLRLQHKCKRQTTKLSGKNRILSLLKMLA